VRCTRCRAKAEVQLRAHNSAFCRPCYLFYFRRQVERAIAGERMFAPAERLLVAVSGGKDSLALWDVLAGLGYDTTGLYLGLGIDYIVDECPNAAGASQLLYKDVLNRLEAASPGTKLAFVKEFLRTAQPAFARIERDAPNQCEGCGMPAYGSLCAFCRLVREVQAKASPVVAGARG